MARDTESKVRHNYTILCEHFIIGKDDRISLINVLRNVVLDELPGALPRLGIVVSFTGGAGKKCSVAIEGPGRSEIARVPDQEIKPPDQAALQNPHRQFETYIALLAQPVRFEVEGVHHVLVRVGGRVVRREPFGVLRRASTEDTPT